MKKLTALILFVLLLAGCTGEPAPEQVITRPPEDSRPVQSGEEASLPTENGAQTPAVLGNYTFVTGGVELVPGAPFDPNVLPEAESVYQVPSCAIEGTDNLYNYGSFELTAFDDGKQELIYSILLKDPNIATTEGLALGDSREKMISLYGEGFTQQGAACVYTGDAEILFIILQEDTVSSVEYRMIVE